MSSAADQMFVPAVGAGGSAKAKAKAEKRARKAKARQDLMLRMQNAAAVMVQRAFRRRMFRKRMHMLTRHTSVAAAKIQLAWRWHMDRSKKQEKQFIVKRLTVLMDSLTVSLHERELRMVERDGPSRPFRVSVCVARTLNATGHSRVTLSLR